MSHLSVNAKENGYKPRDQKCGIHNQTEEQRRLNSRKGGQSHVGKIGVSKNGKKTKISRDQIDAYVSNGWIIEWKN